MSPVSEARKRANEKYTKANYDEIKVRVPKGKKKIIQQYAMDVGESTTAFINRAIDERIERTNAIADTMDVVPDAKAEKQEHKPKPPKKSETHYKPFTESDARRIDFPELLHNIRYQIDISDTYGMDVLSTLLEKAKQQEAENSASE